MAAGLPSHKPFKIDKQDMPIIKKEQGQPEK